MRAAPPKPSPTDHFLLRLRGEVSEGCPHQRITRCLLFKVSNSCLAGHSLSRMQLSPSSRESQVTLPRESENPLYDHIASCQFVIPSLRSPTFRISEGSTPNFLVTDDRSKSVPWILSSTVYSCMSLLCYFHPSRQFFNFAAWFQVFTSLNGLPRAQFSPRR